METQRDSEKVLSSLRSSTEKTNLVLFKIHLSRGRDVIKGLHCYSNEVLIWRNLTMKIERESFNPFVEDVLIIAHEHVLPPEMVDEQSNSVLQTMEIQFRVPGSREIKNFLKNNWKLSSNRLSSQKLVKTQTYVPLRSKIMWQFSKVFSTSKCVFLFTSLKIENSLFCTRRNLKDYKKLNPLNFFAFFLAAQCGDSRLRREFEYE